MMMELKRLARIGALPLLIAACGDGDDVPELPTGVMDAGFFDAGPLDARVEAGRDTGVASND